MSELTQSRCVACNKDAPLATPEERSHWKPLIPDWTLREVDGIERLERTFRFSNFVEALEFTNSVGRLAESQNHHPALLTEWGKVTVSWWTHKIKGLHRNDFICAAKTDQLHG